MARPYSVVGISSKASRSAENPASPFNWCTMIDPVPWIIGPAGRERGRAPSIAGLAFGGDIVAAAVIARSAFTVP
jgi:hypothetical protein